MSDANGLLDRIEEGIIAHGGDLGGWTRRADDTLQLFDGRVTLRAELQDQDPAAREGTLHAHVFTMLHEHDDEVLDACLMGMGDDREAAIGQAAAIWIMSVAGPIKSFLDNRPVCMTCQTGVAGGDAEQGYSPHDYGLGGLRAYVGPSIARGFTNTSEKFEPTKEDAKPWFRFAAESAAPRRVHLAKATVVAQGPDAWERILEIDGHDVSHTDSNWPTDVKGSDFGYLTRFAVFEFPRNSAEIARRAELERTIRHFAEQLPRCDSVDQLMEAMTRQGFSSDLVDEVEAISTIAFGRALFEDLGIRYSPTVIRARRNGRIEADVPLMSLPAYTRAKAIAAQLRHTMPERDFQALCLYNAESHAIMQALESAGEQPDMSKITMYPCVVPDRGTSDQTMNAALALLNDMVQRNRASKKKPWWKFW